MRCPSCGTELPDSAKFCFECGQRLVVPREPVLTADEIAQIEAESQSEEYATQLKEIIEEGLSVERRDVAILFVDVSGFSTILGALSSEQVRDVMRDVYSVMSGAITRCGGYVNKFIGDEVMAVFGAPIASERPCERAITAVDEIEIGLAAVNFRFKDVLPMPLSVHAGVACGPVEAGKVGESQKLEYEFLGETVNIAKRLTDAAFAKTVFVSSRVNKVAEEAFEFDSLGVQDLPGILRPLEVFRLKGPKAVTGERIGFSELGASMFGRDAEFRVLKATFERLRSCYPDPQPCGPGDAEYRGFSRIFGITGEAGIGKSRLKRELRRHIRENLGRRGARFLAGGSWGIGKTPPYWPIKEQIGSGLGFEPTCKTEEIERGLSSLADDERFDQQHEPYIHQLFGLKSMYVPLAQLEPKSTKDNLWIAIRRLYECWALEKPLVLVFEDMHWADGSTREFIEYLAEFIADFPVLILLLYRPGYEPKFSNIDRIPFTEVRLGPLSDDAETDLLDFYLAPGDAKQGLVRRVRKYSEGNPLFAEEFLHLLLERGKLRLEDGKMHLTEPIEEMPLPTGLSGVLAERFDRLSREDKRVAYYGAIIGRSFLYGIVCDLHERLHGSRDVKDALRTLVSREIIFERQVEPDLEYVFKHALTREILASRLVDSLRRELSRLIATCIEELYGDRIDEFQGMLSEHREAAGDIEKAARHAAFCAIHEQKQQNNFESLDAFERYDRLCGACSEAPLSVQEQADLLESRIGLLDVLGRWNESMASCKQLAELAGGRWCPKALNWQARIKYETGEYDEALDLANNALSLLHRAEDPKEHAHSISLIGIVSGNRGDYDEALRCYQLALSMDTDLHNKRGIATDLRNIGTVHADQGDYGQALRCFTKALVICQELADRRGVAAVVGNIGTVCALRCEYGEALRHFNEALVICRELADKRGIAAVVTNIGTVCADSGDHDEALRRFNEAFSISQELADKRGIAAAVGNIGTIHWTRGDHDRALRCYDEAVSILRELGDNRGIAACLGNIGLAHVARGDYDEALRCYDEAASILRELGDRARQALNLSNIASVRSERSEWVEARRAALEAEQICRDAGDTGYALETQSILCRCDAADSDWVSFSTRETETLSLLEETTNPELVIVCLLNLAKAQLQVAAWHDDPKSISPPSSRREALNKATDYASQAKQLAGTRGMKGYVHKAEELLAEIATLTTEKA